MFLDFIVDTINANLQFFINCSISVCFHFCCEIKNRRRPGYFHFFLLNAYFYFDGCINFANTITYFIMVYFILIIYLFIFYFFICLGFYEYIFSVNLFNAIRLAITFSTHLCMCVCI